MHINTDPITPPNYSHNLVCDIPFPLEKCEATDLRNTRIHILNW